MESARYWYQVKKTDVRARLLADRHYSRQTIGHPEFCAPGHNIVLIIPRGCAAAAVWVSQRPAPGNDLDVRKDGFEYWNNGIFRNEQSGIPSSVLIKEALQITEALWGDKLPADGMHSFVDPEKVAGVKVRGRLVHGWVFQKAGFTLHDEITKERNLLRWIYSAEKLRQIKPLLPRKEQLGLFTGNEAIA